MARRIELIAGEEAEGRKLSSYLKSRIGASSALLTQLKKRPEGILVNGKNAYTNYILSAEDRIVLEVPSLFSERKQESNIAPVPHPDVSIVAQDEDFVVLDKPAGMPVHPSRAHLYDTLANGFLALFPDHVYHPITRLDSDTSGLVLVATNMYAANVDRMAVTRLYYGITDRPVHFFRCRFDAPIEREEPFSPKRMVRPDGKPAVTHAFCLAKQGGLSLLAFRLETGRTHQIRVHCAHAGIPLCGDTLYGGTPLINRQALHAARLAVRNPVTGKVLKAQSPLPSDMAALWEEACSPSTL